MGLHPQGRVLQTRWVALEARERLLQVLADLAEPTATALPRVSARACDAGAPASAPPPSRVLSGLSAPPAMWAGHSAQPG